MTVDKAVAIFRGKRLLHHIACSVVSSCSQLGWDIPEQTMSDINARLHDPNNLEQFYRNLADHFISYKLTEHQVQAFLSADTLLHTLSVPAELFVEVARGMSHICMRHLLGESYREIIPPRIRVFALLEDIEEDTSEVQDPKPEELEN